MGPLGAEDLQRGPPLRDKSVPWISIDVPNGGEWAEMGALQLGRQVHQAGRPVFEGGSRRMQPPDNTFRRWQERYAVTTHVLSECYRQKRVVGQRAKTIAKIIGESTPFLVPEKVEAFNRNHSLLTAWANDTTFPNPHGYEQTYTNADLDTWRREIRRIWERPLWRHTEPLLVARLGIDGHGPDLAGRWRRVVQSLEAVIINGDDIERVKGLEFQHAFLIVSGELYDELEHGFGGSGQARYFARRLLRIPFSRAKDSVVTFVVRDS